MKYRNIEALDYIYNLVSSSSSYNVLAACQSYENELMRKAQIEANNLAAQQNELAAQRNAIAEERNQILDQTRKDQNPAAIANTIQNHNRNSSLRDIVNKM